MSRQDKELDRSIQKSVQVSLILSIFFEVRTMTSLISSTTNSAQDKYNHITEELMPKGFHFRLFQLINTRYYLSFLST